MFVAALAFRWLLAVVLVVSALAKIGRVAVLREAIVRYDLVPDSLVASVARLLPTAELLLGLLLATGVLVAPAAVATACLFVVFAAAIAVSLARGEHFDCGCGLGAPTEISWSHVGGNVLLTGFSAVVAIEPAVLALGRGHVSGAPTSNNLAAVPLGVLLTCVASRLLRPLRDTISTPRRELGSSTSLRPSTLES